MDIVKTIIAKAKHGSSPEQIESFLLNKGESLEEVNKGFQTYNYQAQLASYIRGEMAKGHSLKEVKEYLKEQNYRNQDIQNAAAILNITLIQTPGNLSIKSVVFITFGLVVLSALGFLIPLLFQDPVNENLNFEIGITTATVQPQAQVLFWSSVDGEFQDLTLSYQLVDQDQNTLLQKERPLFGSDTTIQLTAPQEGEYAIFATINHRDEKLFEERLYFIVNGVEQNTQQPDEVIVVNCEDDLCYYDLAKKTADPEYCKPIKSREDKDTCFFLLALGKKDTSLCEFVFDVELKNSCNLIEE